VGVRGGLDHSCLEFGVIRSSVQQVTQQAPSDAGRPHSGSRPVTDGQQVQPRSGGAVSRSGDLSIHWMRGRPGDGAAGVSGGFSDGARNWEMTTGSPGAQFQEEHHHDVSNRICCDT
jgi:hypothetical protein